MKNRHLIINCSVIAALVAVVCWMTYEWPYWDTNTCIRDALEKVQKVDDPPDEMVLDEKDAWGHPLLFRFKKDTTRLTYTVISVGPDGKEGTADDMSQSYVDYNIARAFGAGTAQRMREFLKGLGEGWNKKSKYDPEKK